LGSRVKLRRWLSGYRIFIRKLVGIEDEEDVCDFVALVERQAQDDFKMIRELALVAWEFCHASWGNRSIA